jgi:phage tail P2-like protein
MGKFQTLLPSDATALDIAVSYANFNRFETLAYDLEATLDPYRTNKKFLPFVAWGEGTQLWEENWSESTMREWAGEQTHFQARRGTEYAYRRALRTMGFDLVQIVTAPQGFYASPDLPKDYWDKWIRQMPQIRIFLGSEKGTSYGDEFFADDGFAGVAGAGRDDGWKYHGRKAVIRQNGVDTPLKTYQFAPYSETREAFSIDRVSTPGLVTLGFIVGEDFLGEDKFIGFADTEPKLLTIRLDQSYRHEESRLQLDTVTPSLEPLTVNYERDSDTESAGDSWFIGDGGPSVSARPGSRGADDRGHQLRR